MLKSYGISLSQTNESNHKRLAQQQSQFVGRTLLNTVTTTAATTAAQLLLKVLQTNKHHSRDIKQTRATDCSITGHATALSGDRHEQQVCKRLLAYRYMLSIAPRFHAEILDIRI